MNEKMEIVLEVSSVIFWAFSVVSLIFWLILVILSKDFANYKAATLCISYFTIMLAAICKTDYDKKYLIKKGSIITVFYILLFFFFS